MSTRQIGKSASHAAMEVAEEERRSAYIKPDGGREGGAVARMKRREQVKMKPSTSGVERGGIELEDEERAMQECKEDGWPAQKRGERRAMAEHLCAKR